MKFKAVTLAVLMSVSALAHAKLDVQVYQAGADSFDVTSTLVVGEKEAILIDTGFTRADALRIAANVLDSNKTLTTVLVSQADPDYYFGVETIKEIFPDVKVVAPPAVLAKIQNKLPTKLATWSPKMGANAPRNPVLPTPLMGQTLTLEGQTIEIRGTTGILAHRPYVWIPSIKTLTGVGIYGNMHVWTADTATAKERQAWIAQLDEMKALKPTKVIAGHMSAGTPTDVSVIDFTKTYLQDFERAVKASNNSQTLIATMQKTYPKLVGIDSLELGAKVVKGEMVW